MRCISVGWSSSYLCVMRCSPQGRGSQFRVTQRASLYNALGSTHAWARHSLAGELLSRGLSRLSLNALWWCGNGVGICPPACAPGYLIAGVGGLCLFRRPSLQLTQDSTPCCGSSTSESWRQTLHGATSRHECRLFLGSCNCRVAGFTHSDAAGKKRIGHLCVSLRIVQPGHQMRLGSDSSAHLHISSQP